MIIIEKTMKSEKIYEGRIINVRVDTVELPHKKYSKREIVEHPGAVAIVPITSNKEIILVKQFRKSVEEVLLEIPAGKLEPDEDPYECATRELKEETGCSTKSLKKIFDFYTTPGFSNEIIHIYLASDVIEGDADPDEGEYIEILKMPVNDVLEKIKIGEIKDAKTIVAILTYFNFYK